MENVDFELVPAKEPQIDFDLVPTKDSTTIQSVAKPSTWQDINNAADKMFSLDALQSIGRGVGTLASIPVAFPASGIIGGVEATGKTLGRGLGSLLAGEGWSGVKKAAESSFLEGADTIDQIGSLPSQVYLGAPAPESQKFKVQSLAPPTTEQMTPEQEVVSLIGLPFEKLAELNKYISEGKEDEMPSALRYTLGAIPEALLYTVGFGGLAKFGMKPFQIRQRAKVFEKRLKVADEAKIPQTVSSGQIRQPIVSPDILATTTAAAGAATSARKRRRLVDDIQKKQEDLTKFQDMIKKKQEEPTKVIIDDEEVPVATKLDLEQKKTIEENVNTLGNTEKVRELYNRDDSVSIYARELAAKKFKDGGIENGQVQTETKMKSETPSVQKLNKGALTEAEVKELVDTNVFAPEEIDAIKKLPGFKQRDQYNRTFNIVPETNYTPESIAKAEEIFTKVEAAARNRRSSAKDIEDLKKVGWSEADIGKMSETEVRRKAKIARGEVNPLSPNADQIGKMSEVEVELKALREELKDVPIDQITPEQEARMEELTKKLDAEIGIDELIEPIERPKVLMQVDENGEPVMTLDAFLARKALVKERLDIAAAKSNKPKKGMYRKRPTKLEEVDEVELIPNEDLSPITDIGTKPSRTRAQEINKEREGRSGSAEEWEAKLEAEGMPAELNFDYAKKESVGEALGRVIFEQLTKDSEPARAKVEGDIDRLINRRRTIISKTKERNTLVTASKHIPLDLENAKVWFEKLSKYDSLVDTTITHKQSAYTRKAISKAVADKVITPEEARFMNVVFSTLKKQPTFDLEIDKTGLPDKTSGLYRLADNLIKIKDPKYTAHEVAHWAFYNLLSSADRKTYYNHFMETYYRPDGKLDVIKLRRSTTDPRNAVTSPGEAFAAKMSDFMFDKVITPAEKSLFMKVTEWFNTLVNNLRKRTNTDYTGVEDIFKKVLETEGERHDWKEVSVIAPEGSTRTMGSPYNARLVKQGSSKIFDKFLDAFIGSGEGGALRGWGHYFTDSEGLARHYAKTAASRGSGGTKLVVDGKDYDISRAYIPLSELRDLSTQTRNHKELIITKLLSHAEYLRKQIASTKNRSSNIYNYKRNYKDLTDYRNALSEVDKIVTDLENAKSVTVERPKKVIHHVEIPDDVRLLDLDKPIPKDIAEILSKALDKAFYQDKLPYEVKDQYGRVKNGVRIIQDDLKSINNKTTEYGVLVEDLVDPFTDTVLAQKGDLITRQMQGFFNSNNCIERIKMKPANKEKADKWLTGAYAVKDALKNRPDSVTYETLKRNLLKEFKLDEKDFDAWAKGKASHFDIVTKNVEPEYFLTKKPFTGEDLQQSLWSLFSNQNNITKQEAKKLTSAFLRDEVGLQGNTFVGEGSGKQNYVIFDENVPKIKSSVTFDMLGFQQMYERLASLGDTFKKARMDDSGRRILGEIKGNDWGAAEEINKQTIFSTDNSKFSERLYRNLGPWTTSPIFDKWTRNERHVYNTNLADMYIGHKFDQHRTTLDSIRLALKKGVGDPTNVRKVVEGKIEGTPAEQQAAVEVRQWLDVMKERYKVFMLNEYKDNLSKSEYNALLDIISGSDLDSVKAKYPKLDTETIDSIAAKHKEIDTWGIDNYLPNVESGRFKLLVNETTEDGKSYRKLVAIGLSEKDAIRKATQYLEENPETKELYVDTDYKMISDDKTRVTRSQYYGMMGSLAKKMTESIDGIDKGVAKNLAAATMKRKFKIIPTDSYSPFLEPRRDILKGEEDIFPVLKSYAHSIEKKMALDPVIDAIRNDLPKMNKFEKDSILDYIEDVKGRYSKADKIVDDIFRTYRGYSRLISRVRTAQANLKLGYRPVAAGVNLASGQMHVWVKRGLPTYVEGIKFLNTPEGRKFVEDIEPFLGTNIVDTGVDIQSKTPLWKPLGLFQKSEPLNRKVSAAAAYVQGLKEGMSPEAAQIFAIRANWAEQFTYNIANLPKLMRGPTGKLLTQFKPYLVKEIEFMSSLSGKEWARYLGMQLALGGPRAYMIVLKSLPILSAFGFWEEAMDIAEEWMNKNAPLASRGVGGLPGVVDPKYAFDMSAAASFQFPAGPMDFAGPALSDLANIKKNVLDPLFTYGPYAEDLKKTGDIAPIVRHWTRLMKFTFTDDNWLKDTKGNKLYEVKDIVPFYLQSIAGVESVDIARIRAEERILAQRDVRTRGLVTRIINEAMKHVIDGTPMPDDLVQRMGKYNITGDTLKRRVKRSNLPPDLRIMLDTEVIRRPEVIEQFPNNEDYGFSE